MAGYALCTLFIAAGTFAQASSRAQQLCAEFRDCNHIEAGATTKCLKDSLLTVGITKSRIQGENPKSMGPHLRKTGFIEQSKNLLPKVPDGAVLIVKPGASCAREPGTIAVKCAGEWINRAKVHVANHCAYEIYTHPGLK